MAFNGSGTFVRLYNWVTDAAANIKIRADRMDAEMDGFATGLSTCLTKDGQTTVTANLPMSNYRHTGVGEAVSRTDYSRFSQLQDGKANWVDAGGTADAITAAYTIPVTTLVDGQLCFVRAGAANATTTPTFSPNGLTARTIVKNGGAALSAGDIVGDGHELILRYDLTNTRWELLNPFNVPSVTSGNNTFSGDNTFTGDVRFPDDGELTIASGVITVTGANHTVDTEADAASDNLDTINGGNDGQILFLSTENSARDVVLTTAGNIVLGGASTVTLGTTSDKVLLKYDAATSKWHQIAATASQGAKADTALQNTTSGLIVNRAYAEYTSNSDLTTVLPNDDTIPQNTEGTEIVAAGITPKSATNRVRATFRGMVSGDASVGYMSAALFIDSTANALAATSQFNSITGTVQNVVLIHEFVPGTTSSITLKIRVGPNAGTMRMNGTTATRYFGGVAASTLVLEEIVP